MCELARNMLAEKLVDDFYENGEEDIYKEQAHDTDLAEQLKVLVPVEQHGLLYRWEAECAENCGQELRQFADFVARMLMEYKPDSEPIPSLPIQD